jgi:hypothetical protein
VGEALEITGWFIDIVNDPKLSVNSTESTRGLKRNTIRTLTLVEGEEIRAIFNKTII